MKSSTDAHFIVHNKKLTVWTIVGKTVSILVERKETIDEETLSLMVQPQVAICFVFPK